MASIQKRAQNQDRSLCLNTGVKDTIKAEVQQLHQLKQCHIYSPSCQRLGVILGPSLWSSLFLHTAKHREKWRALYIQFITGTLRQEIKVLFEFEGPAETRTLSRGEAKPLSTTQAKQIEGLEAGEGWDKDGEIIFFLFIKSNNNQGLSTWKQAEKTPALKWRLLWPQYISLLCGFIEATHGR